ncbi:MAG: hypothetical protein COY41_04095 [Candidatus Altarchaeum sp. CG_4_10_14_0_8_um_filter_32_851]|nr:MAG: hypothetical protein COY41_04095 [Candidatus Altarchaeum sp. CG_4_10_14_0_8_um_filter_32_851]
MGIGILAAIVIVGVILLSGCIEEPQKNNSVNTSSLNIFNPLKISRSSHFVFENCTIVNPNVKVGLNRGDNFTYKRTIFSKIFPFLSPSFRENFIVVESTDPLPTESLTLNETYIIKEVKHSNTITCYTITINFQYISGIDPQQEMFGSKLINYTVNIDNSTFDRTICDNSTSCGDMFGGMPFALYMLALNREFKGIVEDVIDYKYQKEVFGIKVKDIEKNITLKTTYNVIGEENISNISCYKVKIIKEHICDKENILCNDLFYMVWVDKKRRIVVQYEKYLGNRLIEKSILNTYGL